MAWWKEAAEGSEQVYGGEMEEKEVSKYVVERWERKSRGLCTTKRSRTGRTPWCEHSSKVPETLVMCRPLMWPRAMSGSMVLRQPRFALMSVAHTSTPKVTRMSGICTEPGSHVDVQGQPWVGSYPNKPPHYGDTRGDISLGDFKPKSVGTDCRRLQDCRRASPAPSMGSTKDLILVVWLWENCTTGPVWAANPAHAGEVRKSWPQWHGCVWAGLAPCFHGIEDEGELVQWAWTWESWLCPSPSRSGSRPDSVDAGMLAGWPTQLGPHTDPGLSVDPPQHLPRGADFNCTL